MRLSLHLHSWMLAALMSSAAAEPSTADPDLLPASAFIRSVPRQETSAAEIEAVKYAEQLSRFQSQLEAGQKLRKARQFDAARRTFIGILEAICPAEVQEPALLELALIAEEQKEFSRAQQVYNQFLKHFPNSESAPEVLLRQGLMYREMGAQTLAIAKFYAVGSTALKLDTMNMASYQRLVLQAQTEIANTHFLQGKYGEALDFLKRLLKQETVDLHRARIRHRLVQCQERLGDDKEVEVEAREFLRLHPSASEVPEVRFLLANALKRMGRNRDALQEVSMLLVAQESMGKTNRAAWAYWQQRVGNEIANQLYREGDYMNSLEIYEGLLPLDRRLEWQVPLLYQIGLIYEKLAQPPRAGLVYSNLIAMAALDATQVTQGMRSVIEMARWRSEQMQWQVQAQRTNAFFEGSSPRPRKLAEVKPDLQTPPP